MILLHGVGWLVSYLVSLVNYRCDYVSGLTLSLVNTYITALQD